MILNTKCGIYKRHTRSYDAHNNIILSSRMTNVCLHVDFFVIENNNEKPRDRSEQSQSPQNYSSGPVQRGSETSNDKQWNYSGLDLMSSSGAAAFWQNYSGKKNYLYYNCNS